MADFLTYKIKIAGVERQLRLFPVSDTVSIAALILFGDCELTTAAAKALLDKAPEYDYLMTAEAKGIPLVHEMARLAGAETYFVARKATKVYMPDPISVNVRSITTQRDQVLYLGSDDVEKLRGKRVLLVDDVISTGESLRALEELAKAAGAQVCGRMAILAEGDAAQREDLIFLEPLPLFKADGTILE